MKKYITAVVLIMSVALAAHADLTYMSVSDGASLYPSTFQTLTTTVGDASTGTATIESYAWYDESYWHYSYKIINNDGTPGNNNFGYTVCDPTQPEGIYGFSVTVADAPGGVDNLEVSGYAASTGGGGAWGGIVDVNVFPTEFIEGASWAVNQSGAAGDAQPIAPAQWEYERVQGQWQWTNLNAGDTSTMDDPSQYFQIVSTWAPGEVQGSIVADGSLGGVVQAGGAVLGPAVIPEPATLILFVISALGLHGGRRFIQFA